MTNTKQSTETNMIAMKPIGRVRNDIKPDASPPPGTPLARGGKGWHNPASFGEAVSEVVVDQELADGLDGIEEFSHVIVYFWSGDESGALPSGDDFSLKFRPTGLPEFPLLGVFATRCPVRPNSICATTVEIVERKCNVLRVKGLDTFDGTAVLDIKPYLPYYDSKPDAQIAGWMSDLAKFFLTGQPPA